MAYKHVLIILMLGLFSACSTNTKQDSDSAAVEDKSANSGSGADANVRSYGSDGDRVKGMTALDDPQSLLSVRIIYFDYDSSEIQSQFRDAIEAHAAYLMENPEVVVALEGHADERGSREYNLALGERRSQTVKRQMTLLGVPSAQIRATSYGEERPVSEEHDDFAWSQNRRVEIVY
jgi:peptidoglycan-associated lipoprotein